MVVFNTKLVLQCGKIIIFFLFFISSFIQTVKKIINYQGPNNKICEFYYTCLIIVDRLFKLLKLESMALSLMKGKGVGHRVYKN